MSTLAVRLTVPLVGPVEDLHLQVGAPCRAHQKKKPQPFRAAAFRIKSLAMSYSHMGRPHTTIGAERFHFRVRNGIGWFPLAIAARQPARFRWPSRAFQTRSLHKSEPKIKQSGEFLTILDGMSSVACTSHHIARVPACFGARWPSLPGNWYWLTSRISTPPH